MDLRLSIETQMKWTNDCTGEGWEIITGGSSPGPSPDHPRYGERLHTIRVDETCPHHAEINARFNSGNTIAALASGSDWMTKGMVQTSAEAIYEVLRYVMADGRYGVSFSVLDNDVNGEEVKSLGLPKSVAKDISKKVWIGEGDQFDADTDAYLDESNYDYIDAVQVAYKVNESTGERNETGEKRVRRVLAALDADN